MIVKVESHSQKGKYYNVNTETMTCHCMGYIYRKTCVHIKEAMNIINNVHTKNSLKDFPLFKDRMNAIDFINTYSEEDLINLKHNYEVYERLGTLFKL